VMGTKDALDAAEAWMAVNAVEKELEMSDAQMHYLLQTKAAKLQTLQSQSGVGMVDLDKDEGIATVLGTSKCIRAAVKWIMDELCEKTVTLSSRQLLWLTSQAPKTKSEIRRLQEDTEISFVNVQKEKRAVVLVGPESIVTNAEQWLLDRKDMCIETHPIDKKDLGWIIGKGGANIKELKEDSGVESAQVTDGDEAVVLKGSREAVESARLWLDCHLSYHRELIETEEMISRMRKELQALPVIRGQPVPITAKARQAVKNRDTSNDHGKVVEEQVEDLVEEHVEEHVEEQEQDDESDE